MGGGGVALFDFKFILIPTKLFPSVFSDKV